MDTRVEKEEFLGYEVNCFRDKIIVLVGFVLFMLPLGILTVFVHIGELAQKGGYTLGNFSRKILKKVLDNGKTIWYNKYIK